MNVSVPDPLYVSFLLPFLAHSVEEKKEGDFNRPPDDPADLLPDSHFSYTKIFW